MLRSGVSPFDTARLDLWQIAATLGMHRPGAWWDAEDDARDEVFADEADERAREAPVGSSDGRGQFEPSQVSSGRAKASQRQHRAQIEARRKFARGEGPKPEPVPDGGDVAARRMLQGG